VRFAVIGDYGVDNADEGAVAMLVAALRPDFVVTTGDNNYPSGERTTIDRNIGKYYHAFIGGYRGEYGPGSDRGNRFWPTAGNHDFYSPEGIKPYLDYFPTLPPPGRHYDVVLPPVHLFAVSSDDAEPDGSSVDSPQALAVRDAMAASSACFKIVVFHHPPYSSGAYEVPRLRWPFATWGADAVVTGHEHFYERLEIDGIPYVIDGTGGSGLFDFVRERAETRSRFNRDFGFTLVTATPSGITFEHWTKGQVRTDLYSVAKSCR
jgi:hypothetical protein